MVAPYGTVEDDVPQLPDGDALGDPRDPGPTAAAMIRAVRRVNPVEGMNTIQYTTAQFAEQCVRAALVERLNKWGDGGPPGIHEPGHETGAARVRASVALLENALRALGTRDRGGTRDWLLATLEALRKPLAAAEPYGCHCDGPAAVALIQRVAEALDARAQAQRELSKASPEKAVAARDALIVEEARVGLSMRAIETIAEEIAFPTESILNPAVLEQAETDTAELVSASEGPPATALHKALEQGANASPEVARLWVVFEPASADDRSVYALRWARFSERSR